MDGRLLIAIDRSSPTKALLDMAAGIGADLGAGHLTYANFREAPSQPLSSFSITGMHFLSTASDGCDASAFSALSKGSRRTTSRTLLPRERPTHLNALARVAPEVESLDISLSELVRLVPRHDLICMGRVPGAATRSAGSRPCPRLWNVLRVSPRPLLISPLSYNGLDRVVAACAARSGIKEMIEWGRHWKLALNLPLTVIVSGANRVQLDARLQIAHECLERLALEASCQGLVCRTTDLPQKMEPADLLLMNQSSGWWPLRPCTAKQILGMAPGPVAVLPPKPPLAWPFVNRTRVALLDRPRR